MLEEKLENYLTLGYTLPERPYIIPRNDHSPLENPVNMFNNLLIEKIKSKVGKQDRIALSLSGGMDSSLLLALIKKFTDSKVEAIHIDYGRKEYKYFNKKVKSELRYAEWIGNYFDIKLHTYIPSLEEIDEEKGKIIKNQKKPVGNYSTITNYFACKRARELDFDAVLTGDGGDEMFYGYPIFKYMWILTLPLEYIPSFMIKHLPASIRSFVEYKKKEEMIKPNIQGLGSKRKKKKFYKPDFYDKYADFTNEKIKSWIENFCPFEDIHNITRFLCKQPIYSILEGSDGIFESFNLERISPYLDKEIQNLSFMIEKNPKYQKDLEKEIAKKHLPNKIVNRKIQGLIVPLKLLLDFKPLVKDMKGQINNGDYLGKYLKMEKIMELFNSSDNFNMKVFLWSLYTLSKWLEENKG